MSSDLQPEVNGNTEDWMKVLDRFIDNMQGGQQEDGGDLLLMGRDFSDQYLFPTSDCVVEHRGESRTYRASSISSSSSSLVAFEAAQTKAVERHNHDLVEKKDDERIMSAVRDQEQAPTQNEETTVVLNPTENNQTETNSSRDREGFEHSVDDDSASDADEVGEEVSEDAKEQARYERKRSLEKRRRSDTKTHFDALAKVLAEIEEEFLLNDCCDNDHDEDIKASQQTCTLDADGNSTGFKKISKLLPTKPPSTRVNMISRAISALQRLQVECRKLKKDDKVLRRMIHKMSSYSSDYVDTPKDSSTDPPSSTCTSATNKIFGGPCQKTGSVGMMTNSTTSLQQIPNMINSGTGSFVVPPLPNPAPPTMSLPSEHGYTSSNIFQQQPQIMMVPMMMPYNGAHGQVYMPMTNFMSPFLPNTSATSQFVAQPSGSNGPQLSQQIPNLQAHASFRSMCDPMIQLQNAANCSAFNGPTALPQHAGTNFSASTVQPLSGMSTSLSLNVNNSSLPFQGASFSGSSHQYPLASCTSFPSNLPAWMASNHPTSQQSQQMSLPQQQIAGNMHSNAAFFSQGQQQQAMNMLLNSSLSNLVHPPSEQRPQQQHLFQFEGGRLSGTQDTNLGRHNDVQNNAKKSDGNLAHCA